MTVLSFTPGEITAAQWANTTQTALTLTTNDRGLVAVVQEHSDDWVAAMSAIAAANITIAPAFQRDPKIALTSYLAAQRYNYEIAGIAIPSVANLAGKKVYTDPTSQAKITSAFLMAQGNLLPNGVQWKTMSGDFVSLTQNQIIVMAQAVAAYVQKCYSAESSVLNQINSGLITTTAQIDSALKALISA